MHMFTDRQWVLFILYPIIKAHYLLLWCYLCIIISFKKNLDFGICFIYWYGKDQGLKHYGIAQSPLPQPFIGRSLELAESFVPELGKSLLSLWNDSAPVPSDWKIETHILTAHIRAI